MIGYRLKTLLLSTVDLKAFRCSWLFHRYEHAGEPYEEKPGEALACGAKAP